MKRVFFRAALCGTAIATLLLGSCNKDKDKDTIVPEDESRWLTLTAALKQTTDGDGNGGTYAYAITPEQAINPAFTVRIFDDGQGFHLKSQRTARVQASEDGKYLYNIQYTGADGGIFNKYKVNGAGKFEEIGNEVNTAIILGTSPRWTKAAEGIGVGVSAATATTTEGAAPNHVFKYITSTMTVATLNLDNPSITNTAQFEFPFTTEQKAQGYSVGRIDVPVLNQAKTKIFIGCQVSKIDPTKLSYNSSGTPTWASDVNKIGTLTLVLDYPTLRNPKFIASTQSTLSNNSYRTMSQYVATDGHVYQSTAANLSAGPYILRISKSNDEYDNSYVFNLDVALGITGSRIRAWRYLKDGVGIALYDTGSNTGGYLALINLNTKTATKIATEQEAELNFDQQQGIAVYGDNIYLPLTPVTKDGNVYVVNWKTKTVTKGAKLVNGTGHRFIGSY